VEIQWIKLLRRCVKREREIFLVYIGKNSTTGM
jgi:hypothetical protein